MITQDKVNEDFTSTIQGQGFRIAEENQAFIIEALSKNIYRDPIGTIIREYVSNAYDSNVEAGVDDPVVVSLDKDVSGDFISITDFGVGMSPESIVGVFTKYGASTKSKDNNQIGGFGIGGKSAFAYTDTFFCNTIFGGVMYHYILTKTQNVPQMILVGQEPIEARNGTEIKIYLKQNDKYVFESKITKILCYFKNVSFIKNGEIINQFGKIKQFENDLFVVNEFSDSTHNSMHIVIGQVVYPINWDLINEPRINAKIGLKFGIGSLHLTLSREEIRYTEETIKYIKDKIKELKSLVCNEVQKNNVWCKSYKQYYDTILKLKHVYFGDFNIHIGDFGVEPVYPKMIGVKTDIKLPKTTNLRFLSIKTKLVGDNIKRCEEYFDFNQLRDENTVCYFDDEGQLPPMKAKYLKSLHPDKVVKVLKREKTDYFYYKNLLLDSKYTKPVFKNDNFTKRVIQYRNVFEQPIINELPKLSQIEVTKEFRMNNKNEAKEKKIIEGTEVYNILNTFGKSYRKLYLGGEYVKLHTNIKIRMSRFLFIIVKDLCDLEKVKLYSETEFCETFRIRKKVDKVYFIHTKKKSVYDTLIEQDNVVKFEEIVSKIRFSKRGLNGVFRGRCSNIFSDNFVEFLIVSGVKINNEFLEMFKDRHNCERYSSLYNNSLRFYSKYIDPSCYILSHNVDYEIRRIARLAKNKLFLRVSECFNVNKTTSPMLKEMFGKIDVFKTVLI